MYTHWYNWAQKLPGYEICIMREIISTVYARFTSHLSSMCSYYYACTVSAYRVNCLHMAVSRAYQEAVTLTVPSF